MRKSFYATLFALIVIGLVAGPALSKSSRGSKSAWLGVYSQSVDNEIAEKFDLPVEYGVIVNEVVENSPAEKAGVEEDDIIIKIDGSKISHQLDLVDMIEESRPGDKITLTIIRDDDELKLPVVLKKKPSDKFIWTSKAPKAKSYAYSFFYDDERSYLGVSLMDLTRQLGDFFGVDKGKGALITEVHEDSPAEGAGLKAGDVIVAVDNDKVFDAEDVKEAVGDKEPGEKVDVMIVRNKKEMTIPVEVAEVEDVSREYSFEQFYAPDIDITVPKIKGLLDRGSPLTDLYFDYGDFEEEMEELKKELKSLQKEMKVLREKLE